MKIISIVGARPNFMKIAPLLRAIAKHNELNKLNKPNELKERKIVPILVHTGQHYDYEMSQIFFKDLELPQPDIYLGVGSGTHAEQTGKVMIELEKVLLKEKPDLVVVVGDVNSTLAGALAAVKLCIPVAHVEAGLRSYDRTMPEEINRLLTDAVSDYLFTPSPDADDNLRKEGIPKDKIFLVGDVMVDSLLYNKPQAEKSDILQRLGLLASERPLVAPGPDERGEPGQLNELKERNKLNKRPEQSPVTEYALLTLHRPSNVDEKESLLKIIEALTEISRRIRIVFPAHPRTQKRLKQFNLNLNLNPISQPHSESESQSKSESESQSQSQSNILIVPPLGYLDFLNLEMNAKFVMTDSGGIQEETTVLDIPCLTLRNTTERPITLTRGTNTMVWNQTEKIVEEAFKILDGKGKTGTCFELWDGRAAERIVEILSRGLE
jgi:UDP-N-acetylglucosamine 2-epimerase (non-hydrolysing)